MISYSVSRRTHEFGLRLALGANRWHVVRLVLGQSAILAATGVALGLLGALALARALRSLIYEVSPADPATFATVDPPSSSENPGSAPHDLRVLCRP